MKQKSHCVITGKHNSVPAAHVVSRLPRVEWVSQDFTGGCELSPWQLSWEPLLGGGQYIVNETQHWADLTEKGRLVSFATIWGGYLWETLTLVKEKCSVTRDKYYWFFSSILVLNESQLLQALTVLMGFPSMTAQPGEPPNWNSMGEDYWMWQIAEECFSWAIWGHCIKCCKRGEPLSSAAKIFLIVIQWPHRLPMKASPRVLYLLEPYFLLHP